MEVRIESRIDMELRIGVKDRVVANLSNNMIF